MPFILWLLIFSAGAAAQFLIATEHIFAGLLLYGLAGSCAYVLFYHSKPSVESSGFHSQAASIQQKHFLKRWWPLLPAFIGLAASVWYVRNGTRPLDTQSLSLGLYYWIGAIAFLSIAIARPVIAALRNETKSSLTPLLVLLFLSLCFGIYRLTEIPITVHGDEGMVGDYARRILRGHFDTFFSPSWYAIPQFFYSIPACGMFLFGDNLFGLRMSTAILGTLSVIPFYFLARSWWGKRAAFFSGLLLISNHWFVHLMHCGVNYVQASFFAITLFSLSHFAYRRHSLEWYLGAGLVMGLALMSYQSNYLLPFLWIASQGWYWILRKADFRQTFVATVVPLVIAFLTIGPLLTHEYTNNNKDELFRARARSVVVWNPENYKHLDYVYRANGNGGVIWRNQIERTFLSPILYPDASIQYNGFAPFLDWMTSILFMLAVVIAGYRFFDIRWSMPVLWLIALFFMGGVLTIDAPFFPRLAGVTTLFFLLIGGVFSEVLNVSENRSHARNAAIAFVVLAALTAGGMNLYRYFHTYAKEISPQNVHYTQTHLAYLIAQGNPTTRYYVVEDAHFTFANGTIRFLSEKRIGWTVKTIPDRFPDGPVTVVVHGPMRYLSNSQKTKLAGFSIREHQGVTGKILYTTYSKE